MRYLIYTVAFALCVSQSVFANQAEIQYRNGDCAIQIKETGYVNGYPSPEAFFTKLKVTFPDYEDPTILNTETIRLEYQKNYYPSLIGPAQYFDPNETVSLQAYVPDFDPGHTSSNYAYFRIFYKKPGNSNFFQVLCNQMTRI